MTSSLLIVNSLMSKAKKVNSTNMHTKEEFQS
jgi:hypothetical protein